MADMEQSSEQGMNMAVEVPRRAIILIMGATGTGKSAFVNLLTNDDKILIGHNQESETFGVQTAHFVDQTTGRSVMLIDIPGFDDSRVGITDTDLLEKIVRFLVPDSGEEIHVNGIIYMHRISDPRLGGVSRKNLRMFHSLCGQENLANVRIVTTNWSRVTEEEGNHREADLENGAFKALIDAGAQMRRHTNTLESASQIMSELIPLESMVMAIQEEVKAGKKLADTSAGQVLTAEIQAMERKHKLELADLEREINEAEEEKNRALIAELEQERMALEEKMKRANADREKLEATLGKVSSEDPTGTGHHCQVANEIAETNTTSLDGTIELDGIEHGDTMQLLTEEFARRRAEIQRNREITLHMQAIQDAERRAGMEMHLQTLQARIRDAERVEDRRVGGRRIFEDLCRYLSFG